MSVTPSPPARSLTDVLFENASVGHCLVAPDGTILRANATWLRSAGFSLVDVVGADVIALFPGARDVALAMHTRARAGHHVEVPRHAQRIDGRETWWEGSIDPVPMEGGTGLLISVREVRVAAADVPIAALAQQRQLALDAASMGWWQYDPRTGATKCDARVVEVFGLRGRDQSLESILQVIHSDDAPLVRAAVAAAIDPANPKRYSIEYRLRLPDGAIRWIEAHGTATFEGEGGARHATSFVGTVADVTERKRAQEATARNEELLARLFEHVPVMIAMYEPRLGAFRFNDEFRRVLGWTEEDAAAGDLMTLAYPDPAIRAEASRYMGSLTPGWREFPVTGKDGSVVPAAWANLRLSDDTHVGIGLDLRERKRSEQLRREEERKYRHLFQHSLDAVYLTLADGTILDANPVACQLHGMSVEEIRRAGRAGLVVNDDRHAASLRERARMGHVWAEMTVRRKDGTTVPVEVQSVLLDAARPCDSEAFVITRDIAERKRAEEALRRSERKYAAIYEHAQTPMALIRSPEGTFVEINEAWERMFGWTRAEAVGRTGTELGTVADADRHARMYTEVRERGAVRGFECGYITRAGERRLALFSFDLIEIDGEQFHLGTAVDITERERAVAALRDSEARLRAFVQSDVVGILYGDVDGRVYDCNEELARIIGRSREDVLSGKVRWTDITPPEDLPLDEAALAEARATGRCRPYEKHYARPDGRCVPIHVGYVLLEPDRTRSVAFILDITHRRAAEDDLRAANARLLAEDRRKNDFLGMLSHELRNPLAPIRNALYILDHAEPNGQQARRAKDIANRQVAHMTRLVDDLLDVTRVARGKIELRRQELDIVALASRTAEDYRALMRDRGIDLRLVLPSVPVVVNGDEVRLAQALGNLLHNASKFTPPGGNVTLAVGHQAGGHAVIHVRDSGVGMDAETLQTIFEPFIQARQTLARSEGGLGLGLALVKGLVALHGGEVTASSAGRGRGTEFVVKIPLDRRRAVRPRAPRPAREQEPVVRRRVLVVDDNRDAAESFAELLRMTGHEVVVAHDGRSAVALARAHEPDVVLCDIGLPGMDGYEVARNLRAMGTRNVRLVAVSGYAQPDDVVRATEAGFDAHVAKPPDPEEIERLLRTCGAP